MDKFFFSEKIEIKTLREVKNILGAYNVTASVKDKGAIHQTKCSCLTCTSMLASLCPFSQ